MTVAKECAACAKRGKTWNGCDPSCAFRNMSPFTPDNWNCATANAVRDLLGERHEWTEQTDPRIHYQFCDDQSYATFNVDEIDLPGGRAMTLWVSWYKNRGRTEAMWLLSNYDPPRLPTEDDCVAIMAAFAKAEAKA